MAFFRLTDQSLDKMRTLKGEYEAAGRKLAERQRQIECRAEQLAQLEEKAAQKERAQEDEKRRLCHCEEMLQVREKELDERIDRVKAREQTIKAAYGDLFSRQKTVEDGWRKLGQRNEELNARERTVQLKEEKLEIMYQKLLGQQQNLNKYQSQLEERENEAAQRERTLQQLSQNQQQEESALLRRAELLQEDIRAFYNKKEGKPDVLMYYKDVQLTWAEQYLRGMEKRTATLAAREKAVIEKEQQLAEHEAKMTFTAARADALAQLQGTHERIAALLKEVRQTGQQVNSEIQLLQESFAQKGLHSLIHLIRMLHRINSADAIDAARQLENILQQDFACTRFAPGPGVAFDSQTMAKLDASMPGTVVAELTEPGWKLDDTVLERAVIIPEKED